MSVVLVDPVPRINAWLSTYLGADPTLTGFVPSGVWRGHAPQGKTPPYIVYSYMGDADRVMGNGQMMALIRCRYLVKVITKGNSQQSVQSITDRLMQLLHAVRGGVAGAEIVSVTWLKPVNYEELVAGSGEVFQHIGAEYEIAMRPA